MFINLFIENHAICESMEKYCVAGQATVCNTAHTL